MKETLHVYVDYIDSFCLRHSVKLFYSVVLFCCIYIIWAAYIHGVYISPDSASYLREAENLYHGYGFNYNGLSGGKAWFSLFPILYPFLICCVMKVTACDAYLSSKILACICLILLAAIIKKNIPKPFLFSLIFLNFGLMWCSLITLSEIPFILFVVATVFSLNKFQLASKHLYKYAASILIFCICAFLTRYFGLFTAFLLTIYSLHNLIKWIQTREKIHLVKAFYLFFINAVLISSCVLYFLLNNRMSGYSSGGKRFVFSENYHDLTLDLLRALLDEIYDMFGNVIHGIIFFTGSSAIIDLITAICITAIIICIPWLRRYLKTFSNMSQIFFIAGLIYYLVFIVYRYTSTMDHFYYRFFIPGTVLFLVAGINQLLLHKIKYIHFAVAILCLFLIASYAVPGLTYYKGEGYKEIVRKWDKTYGSIRPNSIVLFSYSNMSFHPGIIWHRSDILFINEMRESSLPALRRTYPNSTIYIDKNYLEEIGESKNTNGFLLLPQ